MALHHIPTRRALDIAGNIRAEIARAKVTQGEVATALGQNQQWVSRRMTGSIPWSADDLVAIADLLGVHPAVLLGGREPDGPRGGGRRAAAWAPRGSNPQPTVFRPTWAAPVIDLRRRVTRRAA